MIFIIFETFLSGSHWALSETDWGVAVVGSISGRQTSLCFVSDPGLHAIPAPSAAPSAVGRERHSCDALNRWVRMLSRALPAASGWLG